MISSFMTPYILKPTNNKFHNEFKALLDNNT
jgi:hypothetical protein